MACGLPVICSESGGNREIVNEGETGYIISPGNVQQLVEKITFLYKFILDNILPYQVLEVLHGRTSHDMVQVSCFFEEWPRLQ